MEEIKDYKVLTPDDGHAVLGEHGLAGAITIFPPKYGSALFGVRGSAGAIIEVESFEEAVNRVKGVIDEFIGEDDFYS